MLPKPPSFIVQTSGWRFIPLQIRRTEMEMIHPSPSTKTPRTPSKNRNASVVRMPFNRSNRPCSNDPPQAVYPGSSHAASQALTRKQSTGELDHPSRLAASLASSPLPSSHQAIFFFFFCCPSNQCHPKSPFIEFSVSPDHSLISDFYLKPRVPRCSQP